MSADAKAWYDESGWCWSGLHAGPCQQAIPHTQGQELSRLLADLEHCMGFRLRWQIRVYPGSKTGLVGYRV